MTFPEHYNPWKNTQIQTSEELLELGVEEPSNMMDISAIRKIKHNRRRRNTTGLLLLLTATGNVVDCDD